MAQVSIRHFSDIVQTAYHSHCNMNVDIQWQWRIEVISICAAITNDKFILEILESCEAVLGPLLFKL